jgi:hypothetical protein
VLEHDRAGRLHFDIRQPPRCIIFQLPVDIREFAFYPAVARVRIRVPGQRTWSFSVEHHLGISLKDIIDAIYQQMQKPLSPSEFMNLQEDKRTAASLHHKTRTANDPAEYARGVRRLDCLYPDVLFVGLSPSDTDGFAWNLHFSSGYQRVG